MSALIHVVAGVLSNRDGHYLVQQRALDAHQGGLWEFPGGKLESGEPRLSGLRRELDEELGIVVTQARPLISVEHHYHDCSVLLDVWRVCEWRGALRSREGQPLAWVALPRFDDYPMPAADAPVVRALKLPSRYLITPPPMEQGEAWLEALERAVDSGIQLIQLRAPGWDEARFAPLAKSAVQRLKGRGEVCVMVNASPQFARDVGADGVHLNAQRLRQLSARDQVGAISTLSASCHDAHELALAARIKVDFAVLGPVHATTSHPGCPAMGWSEFARQVASAPFPVYGLGGLMPDDLDDAFSAGAQGIAAITSLWPG